MHPVQVLSAVFVVCVVYLGMAKRATSKRARSLKRGSAPAKPPVAQSKSLIRRAFDKAKDVAKKAAATISKALKGVKIVKRSAVAERRIKEAERETAKVRRYYEIRDSNVTVLRGPLQVTSSWVDKIAYVRYGRQNGVAVQFHDKQGNPTVQCFYPNTDLRDYDYLRKAASKGKAIWRRFYELPYLIMN